MSEKVAMPEIVLRQGCLIAFRQAVAPNPALLDMRCVYSERIAFPVSCRETHEGVRRFFGRVWTAVHPDGPPLFVRADVLLDCNQTLRLRILFFPDPQIQRPTINVGNDVNAALMLRNRQPACVPAQGELACAVRDRKTGVVDELRSGTAFRLVFMNDGLPISREVQTGRRVERAGSLGK